MSISEKVEATLRKCHLPSPSDSCHIFLYKWGEVLKAILVSLFPLLLLLLRYTCSRALRLSVPLANDIISYLWRFRNTCYFLRLPSALSSGPHLRRICLHTNMNVHERRWITAVLECTCEHVVFHFPSIEQAISHTLRLCPERAAAPQTHLPYPLCHLHTGDSC